MWLRKVFQPIFPLPAKIGFLLDVDFSLKCILVSQNGKDDSTVISAATL